MIKYCGAAICALVAIIILKGQKSEFAYILTISFGILIFGCAVSEFYPIFAELKDMIDGTEFEKYMSTLIKALGITLAVQFTSELCKDAGESAIASKIELVGKAELILLCLPLIRELILLAEVIMQ